ncbi:MAG TPA: ABC transporter permease [Puia sp.]|nr:ABC transporter permease [Puia sp.]
MFKTYLKTAWRRLIKDRTHSIINISGLAIGIAVVLVIGFWIWDELSFDIYNTNYKTIGQIARKEISKSEVYIAAGNNHFPIPLADELRRNYQNVFSHVSLSSDRSSHIVIFNDIHHSVSGIFAEKDFTNIFTLKLIAGSAAGFSDPNSILLSQSVAQSLFGRTSAVGKIIKLDNTQPLKVIGIFEDLPLNNSLSGVGFLCPFDLLVNMEPWVKGVLNDWSNSSFFLYTQVQPGMSDKDISNVIRDAYWSKIKNSVAQIPGNKIELFVHPMKDWHLHSEWRNGIQTGGQIAIVRLFGLIGAFVLLLACINFMNFSTARSGERAKEVGVRKTMGSGRGQLVKQFMSEALLMVLLAFFLGICIVIVSLPWFNEIASKNIIFPFSNTWFWILAMLFILVTTLMSGSYPALYISSFQPVQVLKGGFKTGGSAAFLRKALLTLQFIVSIVIITGTIVVYRQIQLAKNRPLGYDRNGLIRITMTTPDLKGKYDVLRKELLSTGGAVAVAQSSSAATENNFFDDRFEWEGKNLKTHDQSFALTAVTPEYGKTVGWQFAEGRDFSRDFATDNKAVILNEAAAKYMGLANPVGKIIQWNTRQFTVVGIIKDMVKGSPYQPVQQGLFFMSTDIGPEITIRLNPQLSAAKAISEIEPVFKRLNPSAPFDYTFVDDEYSHLFAAEQRTGTLSNVFAMLAILISCLGIFGLASFVAEQRAKEIGIRKVLGASVYNLWLLLTKDFVVIVFIAACIAIPIAWYVAHNWLEGYQYRTHLSWWIFVLTGVLVLLITLLTVSAHVIKAAIANPLKKLRTE